MAKFEDVARRWASDDGKKLKASSMRYRGRDGISWGALVARLVNSPAGPVALITSWRYSDSTSRATNLFASEARKAGYPVFIVPELNTAKHAENLEYFESQAKECEERIANARSRDWQAEADRFRAIAGDYRKAFDIIG